MSGAIPPVRPRRRRAVDAGTLRDSLRTSLPGRVRDAVAAYAAFAAQPPPDDAKGFAAHHAACKAALAHAEMLVRLLRWAEGGVTTADEASAAPEAATEITDLLNRARVALGGDSDEETEEDDPDP